MVIRETAFLATIFILTFFTYTYGWSDVYYRGFAFSGNYEDIPVNFPYTNKLCEATKDEDKRSTFDKKFYEFFKENRDLISSFNLLIGESTDQSSKIAMAVALTREGVSVEKISDVYKMVVNLFCNVIFLDFSNMTVLSSYPIYLQYIHATRTKPEENEIVDIINALYFSEDFSILKLIKERLPDFRLKHSANLNLKVEDVIIEPEAEDKLDKHKDNLGAFKSLIAQRFSDVLSSKLKVAVLPYAKDYLNARMSLAFSDGRMQDFTISPSSYSIDIILRKLTKDKYKDREDAYIYGSFITVKIYDRELGTVYWDNKTKYGAGKTVPKSQESVEDSEVFSSVIKKVMEKTTDEMKEDKKLYKEVIERCLNE